MDDLSYCTWCRRPLAPLPDGYSYVDELNHTIHDSCREERDAYCAHRDSLLAAIAARTSAPIPPKIRAAYLAGIEQVGLTRRCPCLYDSAYGFRGYDTHTFSSDDGRDYDERNAIAGCGLCKGTGEHDQLPELLAISDDVAAARWVKDKIRRGCGPLRGHDGWQFSTLERCEDGRPLDGVVLYSVESMEGGVLSWAEVAEVFRPRLQQSLF